MRKKKADPGRPGIAHSLRSQEASMKTLRWLLPFTFGVDMRAIDAAISLAQSAGATLVPVSLVSASPGRARLEHVQQSKDFLEVVQNKAERHLVPLESYEVFTADVLPSLTILVHDTRCDGIVLVTEGAHTRLMQDEEVKHLLIKPPAALVLIRLPAHTGFTPPVHLGTRFLSRLRRLWEQQETTWQAQSTQVIEEPLWIRTEQRHIG
jgi:hypothetical protein